MTLEDSKLFARSIAEIANEQQDLKQNISADDSDSLLQMGFSEILVATGTITLSSHSYPTDSFILDHVVYGELDSSILKLDGGYSGAAVVIFTDTF